MRAIWYTDSGECFDEKSAEEIEKKHLELFNSARDDTSSKPPAAAEVANEPAAYVVNYDATTDELEMSKPASKAAPSSDSNKLERER